MKAPRLLPLGVAIAATALAAPAAQVPNTLLHTINAPPVGVQVGALFGHSVAVDGGFTVVGIPWDDSSGFQAGLVKVFDSSTGTLRFVLRNPDSISQVASPDWDNFGRSVAISGTRVVVGAEGQGWGAKAHVFDLSSPTPTIPVVTLPGVVGQQSRDYGDFAVSVAISGTRVVVGASNAEGAGKAYVYDLTSSSPTVPVTTLRNPIPKEDWRGFGRSVAISGARVVVGDPRKATGAANSGGVYVYDLGSATPDVPVITLSNPTPAVEDNFGDSLAISGSRLVVGEAPPSGTVANAYVYDLLRVTPTVPVAALAYPAPTAPEPGNDMAYTRVGISGARVVVGAMGADTDANDAGTVFVYDLENGTPTVPVMTLHNPAPAPSDQFGYSVAISGTRLVVSAPYDDTVGFEAGSVYLYDLSGGIPPVPVSAENDPGPLPEDHFGWSVAVSGTRVVVGAPDDDTGATDAGSAYVYDLSGGTPTVPVLVLHNPAPAVKDWFGLSVAISGVYVVVADDYRDSWAGPGNVYVYNLSSPTPSEPVVTLDGPDQMGSDSGSPVAISGTRVVVGSSAASMGGIRAGRVFVYDLSSTTPAVPVTILENPVPLEYDQFGFSVGIAGTRVVVGADLDDMGGIDAGSVYVFDLSSATPTVPVVALENPTVSVRFGSRVAISGEHVVVGNPSAPIRGSFYVYDLSSATPTIPTLSVANPSPSSIRAFGNSVALSGTVVAEATGWDNTGAISSGSAYLYDVGTPTPAIPVGKLYNPAPALNDNFGHSVAIDGALIAVGTPYDDTVMLDKGSVFVFGPSAPEIMVESQPAQTPLVDGDSQSLGSVFENGAASLGFTIRNIGPLPLTGLATSIDGPNAADFTISSGPVAPVSGPSGSTSLTVRFSPGSLGLKTATLHIASNDADESPFDITLTGTGIEPVNRVVDQGSTVSFSVDVPATAAVQWRKDGVDIPGAVGSTLAIGAVQPWQIGVYSARVTTAAGSSVRDVALLGLTDVPSGIWRGLVACYRFDASAEDFCRPNQPASFRSTSGLESDPRRGGVAHVQGKGFGVPPLAGEPPALQGPGGYIQIPKPPLGDGEPFTVSFVIKEEGFSYWHGESFVTMGEAGTTLDLLGHYWIGSLYNTEENYGGPGGPVEPFTSTYVLNGDAVSLNLPWTTYTVVGDGATLQLYRDGQLMGSSAYTKVSTGDFFIGRHSWANGANYSTRLVASVDDLRIFNRALTAPEVQQLFSLVQTTPPAGSFESWALINGLTGTDAGPSADPDSDGLSNSDEFRLGTSPTDGMQLPVRTTVTGTHLRLEWLEKDGVGYSVKETSDLIAPWAASAEVPVSSADQSGVPAGYQRKQVDLPLPPAGTAAAPRFFRVDATKAP